MSCNPLKKLQRLKAAHRINSGIKISTDLTKQKIIMRKLLKALKIIQVVSNENRHKNGLKRLGKGHFEAFRLNPYNPLSYIVVLLILIIGIMLFGFYGIWKQTDTINPFKWD